MKLRTRLMLWFIGAIVVTVAMSFALGSQLWRLLDRGYDIQHEAQLAMLQFETGGAPGLSAWIRKERAKDGVYRALLDERDALLAPVDGRIPPRLREALQRIDQGEDEVRIRGWGRPQTTPVFTDEGRRLRWIVVVPPPPGGLMRRLDTVLLLTIGIIVVSAMAWLTARRITQPLATLQDASRALADGRLGTRVPETVTQRSDEIGALAQDFNHMAARLQRLLDAQRQLLSDISHELRSPLARLRIATELARDSGSTTQLDRIEQEAGRLEDLIAQLLLITRLEQQADSDAQDLVDLGDVVAALCEDARFEAAARRVDVHAELAPGITVRGQSQLLHRAIENVVRNALRYTAEGSGIRLRLSADAAQAQLQIDDQGPGIPEAQLDAVFQPFVRVSQARERSSGGYGLGLAIARRVIESAGGRITARNREGGGLSVSIELPRA